MLLQAKKKSIPPGFPVAPPGGTWSAALPAVPRRAALPGVKASPKDVQNAQAHFTSARVYCSFSDKFFVHII